MAASRRFLAWSAERIFAWLQISYHLRPRSTTTFGEATLRLADIRTGSDSAAHFFSGGVLVLKNAVDPIMATCGNMWDSCTVCWGEAAPYYFAIGALLSSGAKI